MNNNIVTTPEACEKNSLHELTLENCGPVLTVSEVAQVLKISETTVYTLIRAKKLHAIKITNKLYRVSRKSIQEFLQIN